MGSEMCIRDRVSLVSQTVLTRTGTILSTVHAVSITIAGYRINGDCECGCGVPCTLPFLRWNCPTDIAYACTRKLDNNNPPFFGDPTRYAACTLQSDAVTFLIRAWYFYLPCVAYGYESYLWFQFPFTPQKRMELDLQLRPGADYGDSCLLYTSPSPRDS